MAEAYLNTIGNGLIRAFSAGIAPAQRIDPRALKALAAAGLPSDGLSPKAIELFAMPQAPTPDLVVALSAEVLGRQEPHWERPPRRLSWFLPEPVDGVGAAGLLRTLAGRIDQALSDGTFGMPAALARAV